MGWGYTESSKEPLRSSSPQEKTTTKWTPIFLTSLPDGSLSGTYTGGKSVRLSFEPPSEAAGLHWAGVAPTHGHTSQKAS